MLYAASLTQNRVQVLNIIFIFLISKLEHKFQPLIIIYQHDVHKKTCIYFTHYSPLKLELFITKIQLNASFKLQNP